MNQMHLFQPPTLSVTDLTRHLRSLLESDALLQDVWVQGEVSNFSRPASGHLYFTLKDSGAALRCVMWRNTAMRQTFLPRDGDGIEVHGAISVYEVGGQYQLYADVLRPVGEGALYREFLRLKAQLEAEGLFDPQRKRALPSLPGCIGIVTSPTGAALRDMLNTLRRRYPLARVVLAPTPVQGDEAPRAIIAALQNLNRLAQPDVILVARGGGSIEDLWAFNHEGVARAIAASPAPVITGIGHETDFTIADFVADLRSPTPTAAAELSVPDGGELRAGVWDLAERLGRAAAADLSQRRWALADAQNRLLLHSPLVRLRSDRQRMDELTHRLTTAAAHSLALQHARLQGTAQRLDSLNPLAVLARGFALVTAEDGQVVHRLGQARPDQRLHVRVSDGSFDVKVEKPPVND